MRIFAVAHKIPYGLFARSTRDMVLVQEGGDRQFGCHVQCHRHIKITLSEQVLY